MQSQQTPSLGQEEYVQVQNALFRSSFLHSIKVTRVGKIRLSSIRTSSDEHVKSRICVNGGNVADTDIA